jgi:hypothetical protein
MAKRGWAGKARGKKFALDIRSMLEKAGRVSAGHSLKRC